MKKKRLLSMLLAFALTLTMIIPSVVMFADDYVYSGSDEYEDEYKEYEPMDDDDEYDDEYKEYEDEDEDKEVVITSGELEIAARFEGLTRIVVELVEPPYVVPAPDNVVISNALNPVPRPWYISEADIKSVVTNGTTVIISLTDDALVGDGDLRGRMAQNAVITLPGFENPVAIPRQGMPVLGATGVGLQGTVQHANPNRNPANDLWIDMGNPNPPDHYINPGNQSQGQMRTDHGTDPANWANALSRTSLVNRDIHGLFFVVDFPDARAEDNTGINAWPVDADPADWYNFYNGERLMTAPQIFGWRTRFTEEWLYETSFGNLNQTFTPIFNSEREDGIYRMLHSLYPTAWYLPGGVIFERDRQAGVDMSDLFALYPWLETNPPGWLGYAFGRGLPAGQAVFQSVATGVARPELVTAMRRDLDAFLASLPDDDFRRQPGFRFHTWDGAAVENAPGITFGTGNAGGNNWGTQMGFRPESVGGTTNGAAPSLGYGLRFNTTTGQDSYERWKFKHHVHELYHQLGFSDNYSEGQVHGPAAGSMDPYTGQFSQSYPVGPFHLMGLINIPSPDAFANLKWRNGWFRDDQVVGLNTVGTHQVELTPIETEGGTKLVIIPHPTDRGVYLSAELRGGRIGANDNFRFFTSTDWHYPSGNAEADALSVRSTIRDRRMGSRNAPGVLIHITNANRGGTNTPTVVRDVLPRNPETQHERAHGGYFDRQLYASVLGPYSGIFEHSLPEWGVTFSVDPGYQFDLGPDYLGSSAMRPAYYRANNPMMLTVNIEEPTVEDRTVRLYDAQFIDMNSIQFRTSHDLRGHTHHSNFFSFTVRKNGEVVAGRTAPAAAAGSIVNAGGVRVIQVTSNTIRLGFFGVAPGASNNPGPGNVNRSPFTLDDITGRSGANITVQFSPPAGNRELMLMQGPEVVVSPSRTVTNDNIDIVTLSDVRFVSPSRIVASSDRDLGGFTFGNVGRTAIRITRPDGTIVQPNQFIAPATSLFNMGSVFPGALNMPDGFHIFPAAFDNVNNELHINLLATGAAAPFANLDQTIGVTVEIIEPVSNFAHNRGSIPGGSPTPMNVPVARWNHQVSMSIGAEPAEAQVARLSGFFNGLIDASAEEKATLNIIGGHVGTVVRTELDIEISGTGSLTENDLKIFDPLTGISTPLAEWLTLFCSDNGWLGYSRYRNDFPMLGDDLIFELDTTSPSAEGIYEYSIKFRNPDTGTVWASVEGTFGVAYVTADFISIHETARNSRQWAVSFWVTKTFDGEILERFEERFIIPGANPNLRGSFTFDEGHVLEGRTIVYDIRNNGSNVVTFDLR